MARQSPPRTITGVMKRVDRGEKDFIWSTGIHLTDLVWFLCGTARIDSIRIEPVAGTMEERIDITGGDWSVMIQTGVHQPWRVRAVRRGEVEIDRSADPATPTFERNGTLAETAAFLRAILNNQPMHPDIADAMPGTRLASSLSMQDE
jgi:hypothetical protein